MKKLLCEILIIVSLVSLVSLVSVFGFWALNEWKKSNTQRKWESIRDAGIDLDYKKGVSGGWALQEWRKRHPGPESIKYEIIKNKMGSYDVLLPSGMICKGYYPSYSAAKRQVDFLIKREKPVEVYQGKWHKTYLEVIGK